MAKKHTRPGNTKPKKHYRVLALDGGGIRGIITAVWLAELEDRLPGKLRDHFDLIAGTSTGSILACVVTLGVPAREVVNLYEKQGQQVFPGFASRLWSRATRVFGEGFSAPKYTGEGLEAVLKDRFGVDKRLKDLPKSPVVLIPTYDLFSRVPLVIKSNRAEYANLPIWAVVKASCSAPTFFPAQPIKLKDATIPLVDGGVVANNPTACAIAEAIALNTKAKTGLGLGDLIVASFGTGQTTRSITLEEGKDWGAVQWIIPLIDVLMDGPNDATDYIARQLIDKDRYLRFQTPLTTGYDDMDRADPTNINALKALANAYLASPEGKEKLDRLVAALA